MSGTGQSKAEYACCCTENSEISMCIYYCDFVILD